MLKPIIKIKMLKLSSRSCFDETLVVTSVHRRRLRQETEEEKKIYF